MEPQRLRAILASARSGSPEGYKALLEEYGPRLYGYFFRSTGNHHDAEDLLSELTLRLVKCLKTYDHRDRFDQWLFRIGANMIRDRIRRMRASPGPISIWAQDESGLSISDQLAGPDIETGADMLAAEASLEMNEALEKLDASTRQMLLMRHFGQMSFKEIAEMFNCPIGTVLARVHRGMAALRKIMGAENED
jgi:RNA polymerase sigma-70 factor (ECF subfamily)